MKRSNRKGKKTDGQVKQERKENWRTGQTEKKWKLTDGQTEKEK